MTSMDPVWQHLKDYALARFQTFGQTSFRDMRADTDVFYRVPDAYLDDLLRQVDPIWRWLDRCVSGVDPALRADTLDFFVEHMAAYVHQRNQFIELGRRETHDLTALYAWFLADFRDSLRRAQQREDLRQRISRTLAVHREDLAHFVDQLAVTHGGESLVFSEPTASTYSPALQLQVLGLSLERMRGPVLDLGCGPDARLVTYLRAQGFAAAGVERLPSELPFVAQGDWLTAEVGVAQWGTVISHMAFSTHFLHHHLRPDGQHERYARRYMTLLGALAAGGSFVYAPGLPFIEALLDPALYRVERRALPALAANPVHDTLRAQLGADVFYACRVTRR